ncbi:MAG: hypothetical protein KC547_16375 [Anaerolineae bacterium]|nr:hypothetical protein [Anaerolineae bacterium]MCA9908767.1 hypothetical protein [Anaerolineae bacterium]
MHVTSTLAIRPRARTPASLAASQFVEIGLQAARCEFTGAFDLTSTLPPIGIVILEDALGSGFCLAEIDFILACRAVY